MTDNIHDLIREFENDQCVRLAAFVERLRVIAGIPPRDNAKPKVSFLDATTAFAQAGFAFDDAKIQRVCRNHAGEWSQKLGSWHVIEPNFSRFVELVKKGEAKFNLAVKVFEVLKADGNARVCSGYSAAHGNGET